MTVKKEMKNIIANALVNANYNYYNVYNTHLQLYFYYQIALNLLANKNSTTTASIHNAIKQRAKRVTRGAVFNSNREKEFALDRLIGREEENDNNSSPQQRKIGFKRVNLMNSIKTTP